MMGVWVEGEQDAGGREVGTARKKGQDLLRQLTDSMNCIWAALLTKFFRLKPLSLFLPSYLMILEMLILEKIETIEKTQIFCSLSLLIS